MLHSSISWFGVVFLLYLSSATSVQADPKIAFTPPTSFAIGSTFSVKCSINQFNLTAVSSYDVIYYFSTFTWATNPQKIFTKMGYYRVTGSQTTFYGIDWQEMFGVTIFKGNQSQLPDYSANIFPSTEKAKGRYRCSLNITETTTGEPPVEYFSNIWNGSFTPSASAYLVVLIGTITATMIQTPGFY